MCCYPRSSFLKHRSWNTVITISLSQEISSKFWNLPPAAFLNNRVYTRQKEKQQEELFLLVATHWCRMSYIRGRRSRWDESISWATRNLQNARRTHNSKITPLTYNSDRILHTAGAPLLGKRPKNMAEVFETYIHTSLRIKGGGPLVGSLLKMPWLPPHSPVVPCSAGPCLGHLWLRFSCYAKQHFLPFLWLLLGQKGWPEYCTVLHSHMTGSKRKKLSYHEEKLLHSSQLTISKI